MRSKQSIHAQLRCVAMFFFFACVVQAQSSTIKWQQNTSTDTPVVVGSPTNVQVTGFPLSPYALLASRQLAVTNTLIGQLEIDLNDDDFTVGIDGFNPAHNLHHMGSTDVFGQYSFNFVPYEPGTPYGQRIYFQTVAQNPTAAPYNLQLSNTVGTYATPAMPRIDTVTPRSIFYGDFVTITGAFFTGSIGPSGAPVVTIGGNAMIIVSYTDNLIQAVAAGGNHSGGVQVISDVGTSPDLSYDPNHYVMLIGNPTTEGSQMSNPMDGHYSLVGEIDSGTDTDTYFVSLEAGEELMLEVMNFDPVNYVVNPYNTQNWNSVQLNSHVELKMPGVPINAIISDNDGASGFAAGIGVVSAQRFVAPFDGDFEITVSASFGFSEGHYMMNTWTKPGNPNEAPEIIGIHPNFVNPGYEIQIFAVGLDLSQPSANIAEFPGPNGTWIQSPMYTVGNGHISAFVPPNAKSGHLRIRNAAGLYSSFTADHFPSFVMMKTLVTPETDIYNLSTSQQVTGTIAIDQEVDNYQLNVAVNKTVRARAFLFDPVTERLMKGKVFDSDYLDPEIRIRELYSGPIHVADSHSGPETAAEIGGAGLPAWTVPFTGSFELSVRSWLFLSSGNYVLEIEIE
ncbi:MAG: hypothetical protein ACI97A_004139 [Planctomycetota bacterium]|jgi:hypothetical protein